jgi:predicted RNA polymerase sigma factor
MRGTLLDHLGQRQMAVQAWTQALRFQPDNATLRKFLEQRTPAGAPATVQIEGDRP